MKNRFLRLIFGMVVLAFSAAAVVLAQRPAQRAAQQPEAVKPALRTADGKPDLSGTWVAQGNGGAAPLDLALTFVGTDKYTWNQEPSPARGAGPEGVDPRLRARRDQDPIFHCYPPGLVRLGPPMNTNGGGPAVRIIQVPDRLTVIYEYRNSVRYIYTDGREHPQNLELTWNGHSIGKWDGDTLVVDTIRLRDESWLDTAGHEHSTQLHVVERLQRVAADRLEVERTLTDPIMFEKPYKQRVVLRLNPNYDLNENRANNDDCTQYMIRKPAFGKGLGGVLGINDHP